MKHFKIKTEYLKSMPETKNVSLLLLETGKILEGTSIGWKDHEAFTKLRFTLERRGYVKTERAWHNGDKVLKSFCLNSYRFKIGDQFPCAIALAIKLSLLPTT